MLITLKNWHLTGAYYIFIVCFNGGLERTIQIFFTLSNAFKFKRIQNHYISLSSLLKGVSGKGAPFFIPIFKEISL